MKRSILLLACLLAINTSFAQFFSWAKSTGGLYNDSLNSIAVDVQGNVISTGSFWGTVDFDPGIGSTNLTSTGLGDIFVQKLDGNGNFIWARSFGQPDMDYGSVVKTDAAGNVYVMGVFRGTVDFDPGPAVYNMTSGHEDFFLLKLDASGNFIWAIQRKTPESGQFIAGECDFELDNSNNVYMTYTFGYSKVSYHRTIVEKANSTGSNIWTRSTIRTGSGSPQATQQDQSIAIDASGNVIVSGTFFGEVNFDTAGTYKLNAGGGLSPFILKLDNSGNFVWARNIQADYPGKAHAYDVATDAGGNIYIVGSFVYVVDFDPGTGTSKVTASSQFGSSMYLLRLTPSGNFFAVRTYQDDGNNSMNAITIDPAGNIYVTGRFESECVFQGFPYVSKKSYQGSTDAFTLKLNSGGLLTWVEHIAGSWGVDAGHSVAVAPNGDVYTGGVFNGTANFNFNDSNGYWLTSNGQIEGFVHKIAHCRVFDTTVMQTGIVLTANDTGVAYQWIDCISGTPVPGANSKSYTATANGSYAVVVSSSDCSDTSGCHTVTGVGIPDVPTGDLHIYPNPVTNILHIDMEKGDGCQLVVTDLTGRRVISTFLNSSHNDMDISSLSKGVYIASVTRNDVPVQIVRLVKM